MLRRVDRRRVGRVDRRRGAIADRHAADRARRVQVRLEERRRERLRVGDVVEVRALGVERQPVARVDVEPEQLVNRSRVLGTIQALERARARIGLRRSRRIDVPLDRGDERGIRVGIGARRRRRRHEPGLQLANHAFGDFGVLRRRGHVEARQRKPGCLPCIAVARRAVPLHDRVVFGRRRNRRMRRDGCGLRDAAFRCRRRRRRALRRADRAEQGAPHNKTARDRPGHMNPAMAHAHILHELPAF